MSLANELADAITAARELHFDGNYAFPPEYFDTTVVVNQPDGSTTPRNPRYCATDLGADKLVGVLVEAGIPAKKSVGHALGWEFVPTHKDDDGNDVPNDAADPKAYGLGGFSDSKLVPYIDLGDGLVSNAGLMLDYFNHGLNGEAAVRNLLADIENQRKGN